MRTASRIIGFAAVILTIAAGPRTAVADQPLFDVSLWAAACANCHGTDGRSPGSIPSIAGRPASVLEAQLLAFKSDTPPVGTTVMGRLAKGFSDDQISALALHFSQISKNIPAEVAKQ